MQDSIEFLSEKIILASHPLESRRLSKLTSRTEGSSGPAHKKSSNSSNHIMKASTPPSLHHAKDPLESTIGRISLPSKSIEFLKAHNPITCTFCFLISPSMSCNGVLLLYHCTVLQPSSCQSQNLTTPRTG